MTFHFSLSLSQVHDFTGKIEKSTPSCSQIFRSSIQLLPEFYQKGEVDSALLFIDYWEYHCGVSELSNRAKILFSISGSHATDLRSLNLMQLITLGGKDLKMNMLAPNTFSYLVYLNGIFPENYTNEFVQDFNSFTTYLADSLYQAGRYGDDFEKDLLDFYRGNYENLWSGLRNNAYGDEDIQTFYNNTIDDALKRRPEFSYSFLTGIWVPNGNASLFGVKPELGFQMGAKINRVMMDVVMAFKFTNSRESYQVFNQDSLFESRGFFGGYIGFETGFVFSRNLRNEWYALGGIAYDGMDLLNFDEDDEYSNVSINSLNLNLGIGYRHFYSASNYIGLRGQYHFVDYQNPGGRDISGNTTTLRLLWGFSGNAAKTYLLPRMYYYD